MLLAIFDDAELAALLPGQMLIGDKNYCGHDFEATLAQAGLHLLRPARQGEPARPGSQFFKPLRQTSSQSTTPSKASWIWNAMAGTPRAG